MVICGPDMQAADHLFSNQELNPWSTEWMLEILKY